MGKSQNKNNIDRQCNTPIFIVLLVIDVYYVYDDIEL